MPKDLLDFLASEGFSSYADGLLRTVDPDEHAWMAEEWIRNRPEVPAAGLYVIARNAYSEFYCLSLEGGCIVKLSYPTGVIVAPKGLLKLKGGAERAAQTFFPWPRREDSTWLTLTASSYFVKHWPNLPPLAKTRYTGLFP